MLTDSDRYQLLKALEQNPNLSQRQLASELGLQPGQVELLPAGTDGQGLGKTENFRNNQNKSAYLYQLTPTGITEKARVTQRFLQRKLEEHQQIEQEIEALKHEVAQQPENEAPPCSLLLAPCSLLLNNLKPKTRDQL